VCLAQLKKSELSEGDHILCLEALARLAWSDDDAREAVANGGGIRSIVDAMLQHPGSDGERACWGWWWRGGGASRTPPGQ
jgi:hypothetical protein